MNYEQLLERLIADGIAEVNEAEGEPKNHHKRDGAIEGFEACRGKTPEQLIELWRDAEDQCTQIRRKRVIDDDENLRDYWKRRYKALQIEFVLNVLSVGLSRPLLPHLPTYRGAMKYAEIVGVSDSASAS